MKGLYLPPSLNLEQASSQLTARYKSDFVRGESLIDITGGFGVDACFLSRGFSHTTYCEKNSDLAAIAAHNFVRLETPIEVYTGDGLEFLRKSAASGKRWDWIYADPGRRHARKGKVVRLQDYAPDIPGNLEWMRNTSRNILIKTSPLLDIGAGLNALSGVREIHIVAVRNEVRELLWWIQASWARSPQIRAVNLESQLPEPFIFTAEEASSASSHFSEPLAFLYEPNAALMKSGAFDLIGQRYGLKKLHPNTHLFTALEQRHFPGRCFAIREVLPYKPGRMPFKQGHVSTRNFPESVDLIRKRNRIRPGGEEYLFFVRVADNSLKVLRTDKV